MVINSGKIRNTYWSRDYISGVKAFLLVVDGNSTRLKDEIETIDKFVSESWSPFIQSMKKLGGADFGVDLMVEQFGIMKIEEQLIELSSGEIRKMYDDNRSYYRELKREIDELYERYAQDLRILKGLYIECEASSKLGRIEVNPSRFAISLPLKLDERLEFKDSASFETFVEELKGRVVMERHMLGLPGLGNESFIGTKLMEAIRRYDSKIDSSLYNLNRLGQALLDLGVIQTYALLSSRSPFDVSNRYTWVAEVKPSNCKSMSLESMQQLYDRFYEQYQKLENSKVTLEKSHMSNCKYYDVRDLAIVRMLDQTRDDFQRIVTNQLFKENGNVTRTVAPAVMPCYNYFSRDNCIPYTQWPQGIRSMFGTSEITQDIVESVVLVLHEIERETQAFHIREQDVLQLWTNDIDISRCSKMKLELLAVFKQNETTNLKALQLFIDGNKDTSKYVTQDWVDLMRLWLLELPGGLCQTQEDIIIVPKMHAPVLDAMVAYLKVAFSRPALEHLLNSNGTSPIVEVLIKEQIKCNSRRGYILGLCGYPDTPYKSDQQEQEQEQEQQQDEFEPLPYSIGPETVISPLSQ